MFDDLLNDDEIMLDVAARAAAAADHGGVIYGDSFLCPILGDDGRPAMPEKIEIETARLLFDVLTSAPQYDIFDYFDSNDLYDYDVLTDTYRINYNAAVNHFKSVLYDRRDIWRDYMTETAENENESDNLRNKARRVLYNLTVLYGKE